jgi:hypothetical protein
MHINAVFTRGTAWTADYGRRYLQDNLMQSCRRLGNCSAVDSVSALDIIAVPDFRVLRPYPYSAGPRIIQHLRGPSRSGLRGGWPYATYATSTTARPLPSIRVARRDTWLVGIVVRSVLCQAVLRFNQPKPMEQRGRIIRFLQ